MAVKHLSNRPSLPWRVYWRNPYTKKIETQHFQTEQEALAHDSLVKHWIRHDPEKLKPQDHHEESALTVSSIVVAYIKDRQFKKKSLQETYYHLQSVIPHIGDIEATKLTHADMRDVVRRLREKGLKANGISRKLSIVKSALNWAEDTELIFSNPIAKFKLPKGQDTQIPPPSENEIAKMLSVAAPHVQRVIILGWYFGMRIGGSELFSLEWSHVDLLRGTILIWCAEKNKDMQWRELVIQPSILPTIQSWFDEDSIKGIRFVINYEGKRVSSIKHSWGNMLKRAGITRRIRPYDLRHAHATQALAHGADIKAVSQNMGHADTTMIHKHYQHVLVKQREEALAVIPNLVIQSGNTNDHISTDICITKVEEIKVKQ